MKSAVDFENFKDHYQDDVQRAVSFAGQNVEFYTEVKAMHLLALAEKHLGNPRDMKVLDVGCGIGLTDAFLAGRFASLDGVDIATGVVERAAQNNPSVRYQSYDGQRLPFPDGSFDMAFTICVLQVVPAALRSRFVEEMRRVLRPGGIAVVFEHNPMNPLTRLVVTRCEMNRGVPLLGKAQIADLLKGAGLSAADGQYVLFFPWRGKFFRKVEGLLSRAPFGAQYFVVGKNP